MPPTPAAARGRASRRSAPGRSRAARPRPRTVPSPRAARRRPCRAACRSSGKPSATCSRPSTGRGPAITWPAWSTMTTSAPPANRRLSAALPSGPEPDPAHDRAIDEPVGTARGHDERDDRGLVDRADHARAHRWLAGQRGLDVRAIAGVDRRAGVAVAAGLDEPVGVDPRDDRVEPELAVGEVDEHRPDLGRVARDDRRHARDRVERLVALSDVAVDVGRRAARPQRGLVDHASGLARVAGVGEQARGDREQRDETGRPPERTTGLCQDPVLIRQPSRACLQPVPEPRVSDPISIASITRA